MKRQNVRKLLLIISVLLFWVTPVKNVIRNVRWI